MYTLNDQRVPKTLSYFTDSTDYSNKNREEPLKPSSITSKKMDEEIPVSSQNCQDGIGFQDIMDLIGTPSCSGEPQVIFEEEEIDVAANQRLEMGLSQGADFPVYRNIHPQNELVPRASLYSSQHCSQPTKPGQYSNLTQTTQAGTQNGSQTQKTSQNFTTSLFSQSQSLFSQTQNPYHPSQAPQLSQPPQNLILQGQEEINELSFPPGQQVERIYEWREHSILEQEEDASEDILDMIFSKGSQFNLGDEENYSKQSVPSKCLIDELYEGMPCQDEPYIRELSPRFDPMVIPEADIETDDIDLMFPELDGDDRFKIGFFEEPLPQEQNQSHQNQPHQNQLLGNSSQVNFSRQNFQSNIAQPLHMEAESNSLVVSSFKHRLQPNSKGGPLASFLASLNQSPYQQPLIHLFLFLEHLLFFLPTKRTALAYLISRYSLTHSQVIEILGVTKPEAMKKSTKTVLCRRMAKILIWVLCRKTAEKDASKAEDLQKIISNL